MSVVWALLFAAGLALVLYVLYGLSRAVMFVFDSLLGLLTLRGGPFEQPRKPKDERDT